MFGAKKIYKITYEINSDIKVESIRCPFALEDGQLCFELDRIYRKFNTVYCGGFNGMYKPSVVVIFLSENYVKDVESVKRKFIKFYERCLK